MRYSTIQIVKPSLSSNPYSATLSGAGLCGDGAVKLRSMVRTTLTLPFRVTEAALRSVRELVGVIEPMMGDAEGVAALESMFWTPMIPTTLLEIPQLIKALDAQIVPVRSVPEHSWLPTPGFPLLGFVLGRSVLCIGGGVVMYYPIYTVASRGKFQDPPSEVKYTATEAEDMTTGEKEARAAARAFVIACLKEDRSCIILKVGG